MCVSKLVGGASTALMGSLTSWFHYGLTIRPYINVQPTIEDVTALPVTLGSGRETMSFCFVRIATDSGIVGYGEACDSFGCSYASVIATLVTDVFAPLLKEQ